MAESVTTAAGMQLGNIPLDTPMVDQAAVSGLLSGQLVVISGMIDTAVSTVWKAGGTKTKDQLLAKTGNTYDLLNAEHEGYVYQLTEDLDVDSTTAAVFVEPSGTHIEAGTDVAVINTGTSQIPVYKFNSLAVTDSSVVKSIYLGDSSGTPLTPTNGSVTLPYASDSSDGILSNGDYETIFGSSGGSSGLVGEVEAISGTVSSLDGSVTTLTLTVSGLSSGFDTLSGAVSGVSSELVTLSGVVDGINNFSEISVYESGSSGNRVTVTASGNSDSVSLVAGDNVTLSVTSGTNSITINASVPSVDYPVTGAKTSGESSDYSVTNKIIQVPKATDTVFGVAKLQDTASASGASNSVAATPKAVATRIAKTVMDANVTKVSADTQTAPSYDTGDTLPNTIYGLIRAIKITDDTAN